MYRRELEALAEFLPKAGVLAMSIHDRPLNVEEKPDDAGPVTDADKALNVFLADALSAAFPGDGVVGEESAPDDIAFRARTWFIDPIDGTREFIKKNGEWSVIVGLAVDGVPSVGGIYQPTEDRLYLGAAGITPFVEHAGARTPLAVRERTPQEATIVMSRSHPDARIQALHASMGVSKSYRHGSVGCKVAQIAEGRADLYINLAGKCQMWDTCGPEALLYAAGGTLRTFSGRISYNGPGTVVPEPFFAASSSLESTCMQHGRQFLKGDQERP